MTAPLWSGDDLVTACNGRISGTEPGAPFEISGISIDSRTLHPGDLFVAILGENNDGHRFVPAAIAAGAAAVLVDAAHEIPRFEGIPVIRVPDTLEALNAIARAARTRTEASVIAVTGSVGKTGTKEALRLCLAACGPTHGAEKSYNNHWGVPLSLARMPAATRFAVFEVGMNHAGEITPLSRLIEPQVAIITTVAPVHLGYLGSETAIADAKAEIFDGLAPDGVAILNRDNPHFARLQRGALQSGKRKVVSFGAHPDCDVGLVALEATGMGSRVRARVHGVICDYVIGAPGRHFVLNSLAVLAAISAVGGDVEMASRQLANISAPVGRGARTRLPLGAGEVELIDESYNANPASVRAALSAMAQTPRQEFPRRIAVLGDMLELGDTGPALHRDLAGALADAGIDLVFTCGALMAHLHEQLPRGAAAAHVEDSADLVTPLLAAIRPGDVVMVKGSLASRMGLLVDALKSLAE